MFDYATYMLEADKLLHNIHKKMLARDFLNAYLLATELVVQARHLQMYAKHVAEENRKDEET